VTAVKLNSKCTLGFVDGDYGNNLSIIPCNTTIEWILATEENLKKGAWIKGSFVAIRKLLK
jgi:hypothetical protein